MWVTQIMYDGILAWQTSLRKNEYGPSGRYKQTLIKLDKV